MPFDPTDLEDAMHAALFRGKPIDALPLAAQHDPWLSAHIADVLEKLGLIDADIDDEYVVFLLVFLSIFLLRFPVSLISILMYPQPSSIKVGTDPSATLYPSIRGLPSQRSLAMENYGRLYVFLWRHRQKTRRSGSTSGTHQSCCCSSATSRWRQAADGNDRRRRRWGSIDKDGRRTQGGHQGLL